MPLTRSEFEAQRASLACRHCGRVGLEAFEVNGGSVGARCPACQSRAPLAGVQWLPKDSAAARRPRHAGDPTPDAVWTANGDHCAFCGKSRTLCVRLRIGLTMQHVRPVVLGGERGPLIPFCARCQEASRAALQETRDIMREIESLDTVIRRIEKNHPELTGDIS